MSLSLGYIYIAEQVATDAPGADGIAAIEAPSAHQSYAALQQRAADEETQEAEPAAEAEPTIVVEELAEETEGQPQQAEQAGGGLLPAHGRSLYSDLFDADNAENTAVSAALPIVSLLCFID